MCFSSEWDTNAQKTYQANYGEIPFGDITLHIPEKIELTTTIHDFLERGKQNDCFYYQVA